MQSLRFCWFRCHTSVVVRRENTFCSDFMKISPIWTVEFCTAKSIRYHHTRPAFGSRYHNSSFVIPKVSSPIWFAPQVQYHWAPEGVWDSIGKVQFGYDISRFFGICPVHFILHHALTPFVDECHQNSHHLFFFCVGEQFVATVRSTTNFFGIHTGKFGKKFISLGWVVS